MKDTPAGRKPISKSIRFEVFKRDSFKCQYCGAVAPDVLLQVDHIRPLADGGTNDITNFITSCEPCNNGKRDRVLSENTAVSKSRNQLELLQDRREQLELMMEWQRGLRDMDTETVNQLADYWEEMVEPFHVTDAGKVNIKKLVKKFTLEEILSAMRTATEVYLKRDDSGKPTHESVNLAFNKIGGVCRVNKASVDKPYLRDLYYLRAILRKKLEGRYYVHWEAFKWMESAYSWGATLEELREIVLEATSWTKFSEAIDDVIIAAKQRASR